MADSEDASVATTSGREVPEGYKVLIEGKGSILQKGNDVFYNPAQARFLLLTLLQYRGLLNLRVTRQFVHWLQVVNRDISIAVLRYFVKQRQLETEAGTAAKSRNRVKGGVTANVVAEEDKVCLHAEVYPADTSLPLHCSGNLHCHVSFCSTMNCSKQYCTASLTAAAINALIYQQTVGCIASTAEFGLRVAHPWS